MSSGRLEVSINVFVAIYSCIGLLPRVMDRLVSEDIIPRISEDAPHSSHLDHEAEFCLDFIRIRYILGILFSRSRRRFVDQSEFET